jgi:hypothetical protein
VQLGQRQRKAVSRETEKIRRSLVPGIAAEVERRQQRREAGRDRVNGHSQGLPEQEHPADDALHRFP